MKVKVNTLVYGQFSLATGLSKRRRAIEALEARPPRQCGDSG